MDGALRFSKQELGRFPTDDETVGLIANRSGSGEALERARGIEPPS